MEFNRFDNSTLDKLEFDEIRSAIASHCHCELGKKLARSMTPSVRTKIVRHWLDQVRGLSAIEEALGLPPLGGVHDVREYVRAAAFPAPLDPSALTKLADTLAATHAVCAWLDRAVAKASALKSFQDQVCNLSSIAHTIREAIDGRGKVLDHASSKLASLRATIESARTRIRLTFDRILRQSHVTRILQYAGATFHNDRMVLPLKAEYRGRIKGIIHRSSDTGATLFVEPAESVELNNTIVRLRDEEAKEIDQILRRLTKHIQVNSKTIMMTLRALASLDLLAAKCRYAKQRNCICPAIDEHSMLDLHEARHPVLLELFHKEAKGGAELRQVVPIDIRLGDDFDILIVTGPNTGGKTVVLKTVGLMVLMTQCGIPIPAGEGSQMPVFRDVFIDIGDEQSLQQSLSTFSSHLATLLDVMRRSGPRTLVLIDELGAGTDPDEGAAIGRTIVAELLDLSAKAVISTHLSALKAVAFTTERVDNASVEFDPESLRPTFHLRIGEPGNSQALIIAKRLGMPARLVQRAKGYLDDSTRVLNKAIAGTLKSRRDAEKARKDAREAAMQSEQERDRWAQEAQALRASKLAFDKWTKWVNELRPGDTVFVKPLRKDAKIVRMILNKQKALVLSGTMQLELPLRDIDPPSEDA